MRIRITGLLTGSIDGIQLGQFRIGHCYDLNASLASCLICERLAEPLDDEVLVPAIQLERQGIGLRHEPFAFTARSVAADRGRPKVRRDPS